MALWDWLPGTRAATKAPKPKRSGGVNVFSLGMAQGYDRMPRRGTAEVLRAYSESPWVHAIVDRISSGVAATEWRVYRAETKPLAKRMARLKGLERGRAFRKALRHDQLEEVEGHPVLDVLELGCPPWFSGRQVMKLWQSYMELAGEGFGVVDANAKGATALWPIPPHWMRERPTPGAETQQQNRFVLTVDGTQGGQKVIPSDFVLWFKHGDPLRPYGPGVGRAQSLGDEIDTDEMAAKTAKHAFLNGARPDILLIPEDPVSKDEAKSLLERWNQKLRGFWNANKVHLLSTKVTALQFAANFRDMQFTELRTWERDMIMQVFGVPPEIFGILEASNRSTIDASDFLWQSKVIVPRVDAMVGTLQTGLMPLYPDSEGLVLGYVSPVEEDREFKRTVYAQAPWAFWVDEHRELAGDEPLEDGAGEVFVSPLGLVAADTPLGAADAFATEPIEEPEDDTEGDSAEEGEDDEDEDAPEEDPEAEGEKRARRRVTKAGPEDVLRQVTGRGMLDALLPTLTETVSAFGAAELEKLGLSISFNESHPKVQEFLRWRSADQVQRITANTRGKLRALLTKANAEGVGNVEIARRISALYKGFRGSRSLVIAQTETARASNFGVLEGMQQGGVSEKEWLSTRDEVVRDTHQALDGQRVPISANFVSPSGAQGPHPGALGRAEEDVLCRCTTLSVVNGETSAGDIETKRVSAWKAHEAKRVPFQRQMVREVRKAFIAQEQAVLAALEK